MGRKLWQPKQFRKRSFKFPEESLGRVMLVVLPPTEDKRVHVEFLCEGPLREAVRAAQVNNPLTIGDGVCNA